MASWPWFPWSTAHGVDTGFLPQIPMSPVGWIFKTVLSTEGLTQGNSQYKSHQPQEQTLLA